VKNMMIDSTPSPEYKLPSGGSRNGSSMKPRFEGEYFNLGVGIYRCPGNFAEDNPKLSKPEG
jgi:hypothetical protein